MVKSVTILLFLLSVCYIYGQKDNVQKEKIKYDTSFIIDYSDKLHLFLSGKKKFTGFAFNDNISDKYIEFSPNNNLNLGFAFTYKWLGFGFAFSLPSSSSDNDTYGKTQKLDAQMNIFSQKFVFDIYFSDYQGFYVKTPLIIDSSWVGGEPYPQLPELNTTTIGVSAYYLVNNKKFSYKASFSLNQKQRKSSGSLILGAVFKIGAVDNDTVFIPSDIWGNDTIHRSIKDVIDFDIGPLVGYAYNWMIKDNFLLSFSLVPGIVYQASGYTYVKNETYLTDIASGLGFALNYRLGIIFDNNKVFGGFQLNNFVTVYEMNNVSKSSKIGNYSFFVGCRINYPKILKFNSKSE
jgi:hypothetical protein